MIACLEVSAGDVEGEAIFAAIGFRCCTVQEFVGWRQMALACNPPNAAHTPGSARQFCYDCIRCVREEMVAQGRCVRADRAKVADSTP